MKTISFKVSDDEARHIRRQAAVENLSVSAFLRLRAAMAAPALPPPGRMRCEFTGAEIFSPLSPPSALTTAQVRDILSDFP